MTQILVDYRISSKCKEALSNFKYEIIYMPPFNVLSEPVSAHPDMLFFKLNSNTLLFHKYYYIQNKVLIDKQNCDIMLSDEPISCKYPHDVLFNSFKIGNFIFGNAKTTSKYIIEYAKKNNLTFVHVNQGYSKCSTCVVNDNAIITADKNIANAATKYGINVLLISNGDVKLHGYNYGFIGGCSGLIDNKLVFYGDIKKHKDFNSIFDFTQKYQVEIISLSDEILYDYGSLICKED